MMKFIKSIDAWFFGNTEEQEDVTTLDKVFFYGPIGLGLISVVYFFNLIN